MKLRQVYVSLHLITNFYQRVQNLYELTFCNCLYLVKSPITKQAVYMRTLEFQRQRLEREIDVSKLRIRQIRESGFPDLNALNQLHDTVERNLQLIEMIDQHMTSNHGREASG